jgi:hypothetical protein
MNYDDLIIDDENLRYCHIYKITNINTNKCYVGQAVSHILNHKRYRPYGCEGRFKTHMSEAFSCKKNQCYYLNNSIRKHGKEAFKVELIIKCRLNESDFYEKNYITELNTLYPNGYNLKNGGYQFSHTDESKRRVSNGIINYFREQKFSKFMKLNINIENDFNKYIKPLNRNGIQYGWYVYINRIKCDFGGVQITLNDSKNMAIEFLKELQIKLAKHLDAGNSLELQTTTLSE